VHLIVIGYVDFNVRYAPLLTNNPGRTLQLFLGVVQFSASLNFVPAINLPQQKSHFASLRLLP
jgi:hypothetical protein